MLRWIVAGQVARFTAEHPTRQEPFPRAAHDGKELTILNTVERQ